MLPLFKRTVALNKCLSSFRFRYSSIPQETTKGISSNPPSDLPSNMKGYYETEEIRTQLDVDSESNQPKEEKQTNKQPNNKETNKRTTH